MKIDNLKLVLEKKFNLIGFIDLADITVGRGSAYKFFKSVYSPEYHLNSRIVFYSSQHNIDKKLIDHLYKAAELVDIGNDFVLFCTPISTAETINYNCTTTSGNFQHFPILLEETKELQDNYYIPDTICAIPWNNIEIKQNGNISPCCMSNFKAGNINTDSLQYIFDNNLQNLRDELLLGNKPEACQSCWDREAQGLTSTRQHNIKRLADTFLTETIEKPTIQSLDIKFNNTCNFKCLICSPEASSLHAQEKLKYLNIPIERQTNWSESDQFINQVNELLPSLQNIDMFGGEPFLIKKFSQVLKTAVDHGFAKNIRLHYNSNGSIWPSELIDYWGHFKEVDIHFSIDAIGDRFNYQRGGEWKDVEKNILKIKNLGLPNLNISIMPSVSILSIYYLDDVLEWANTYKFQLFPSHVFYPAAFALTELTKSAVDIINHKFQSSNWSEMLKILAMINATKASTGDKFREYIGWYDNIRQTNFSDAHPEMAQAMGYSN